MYLFDTNVVSELRKASAGRADRRVLAWTQKVPSESIYLSAVCIQELEIGVLLMERRDPRQGALLRSWLKDQVLPNFGSRILVVDSAVAMKSAALHVPNPMSYRDGFIAATALVHGLTVVTRNVRDFQSTGVQLLNPWRDGSGSD
jgi:predicted nucleic acid-binding protein